jgi:hypothetical protein
MKLSVSVMLKEINEPSETFVIEEEELPALLKKYENDEDFYIDYLPIK